MKRLDDFVMQDVAGENLLVPIAARVMDLNGLITLNATGAFVWELLAQERTVDELADAVAERFEVDSADACADVQAFLGRDLPAWDCLRGEQHSL